MPVSIFLYLNMAEYIFWGQICLFQEIINFDYLNCPLRVRLLVDDTDLMLLSENSIPVWIVKKVLGGLSIFDLKVYAMCSDILFHVVNHCPTSYDCKFYNLDKNILYSSQKQWGSHCCVDWINILLDFFHGTSGMVVETSGFLGFSFLADVSQKFNVFWNRSNS